MESHTAPGRAAIVEFSDYPSSVSMALDEIGASDALRSQRHITLKPNLVTDSPHPITTSVQCVEAIIDYCRACSQAHIVIAEGSGGIDTEEAFRKLGYEDLAARKEVELIDLDKSELVDLRNESMQLLPMFQMPKCLMNTFLVSVPVLKAHSMSDVTLSLKNMFGIAPAKHYGGVHFRKSKLHGNTNSELHRYVLEINTYRKPDMSLIDATIGMAESHLWGPTCDPPVNKIIAGFDPVAVDAVGAELLGFDWHDIGHIQLAHGVLGKAVSPVAHG